MSQSDKKLDERKELVTDQLFNVLQELGPHDYNWLTEELYQIDCLERPHPEYKKEILKNYQGTWEQFVFVWRAYHLHKIAKRLWRKFEKIAKKWPNLDTLLDSVAAENTKVMMKDEADNSIQERSSHNTESSESEGLPSIS